MFFIFAGFGIGSYQNIPLQWQSEFHQRKRSEVKAMQGHWCCTGARTKRTHKDGKSRDPAKRQLGFSSLHNLRHEFGDICRPHRRPGSAFNRVGIFENRCDHLSCWLLSDRFRAHQKMRHV